MSFSDLKKILNKFDLGKIKKISRLGAGANIAYIVESEQGKFLLRFSPKGPRWRSKKEVAAELELINYLLKNNFSVPKPIAAKRNKQILFWQGCFGYLKEFAAGSYRKDLTLKEIEKIGKFLGWFHGLIEGYKTKNKRNHIFDLKETKNLFKKAKKKILKSGFSGSREFIKELEQKINSLSFPDDLPKGMIHEDLDKRHIIWQKGKIVAMIDFDRCYFGYMVLDLGQACRGFCFTNGWTKWSNKNFRALIKGYQLKRRLIKLEKKYLIDAIKFGCLERVLEFIICFVEVTQDPADRIFAQHNLFVLPGLLEKNTKRIADALDKKTPH